MSIRLLVKGDKRAVKRAAARHGVPLTAMQQRNRRGVSEVVASAPCSAGVPVRHWYNQASHLVPGSGYTPGTLVFFSERCGALGRPRRRR
jgi:hypothetical protein